MDAASHTGIDDIREIVEAVRYKPAYARYKVFIIDEVHMLSKAAFNGLLKTLEEPPPHVKFIFATTEIRKVPVTVLSRCQRFDLRRVEADVLAAHFQGILAREGRNAEPEALALIARAAEGSVRDGLSILDQALSHGAGTVAAADVLAMLGLADRARVYDLLDAVLSGDARGAVEQFDGLHADGADPVQIVTDLAEAVHAATRVKAAGEGAVGALSETERGRAAAIAGRLSMAALARAWQMLLKGLDEVGRAPRPMTAAEMLLIRMCYAAGLPPLDEVIQSLTESGGGRPQPGRDGNESRGSRDVADSFAGGEPPQSRRAAAGDAGAPPRPGPAAAPKPSYPAPERAAAPAPPESAAAPSPAGAPAPAAPAATPRLDSFAGLVALAGAKRDVLLKRALEEHCELVRFKPGHIELHLLPGAARDLAGELGKKLQHWTGERWIISLTDERGERPLGPVRRERKARLLEEARRLPAVQSVLRRFPGAEITDVRDLGGEDDGAEKD
jgi:DNA polymerase-3 subunit gamma/tau